MARLIDAEAYIEAIILYWQHHDGDTAMQNTIDLLRDAPPEVVTCSDCVHGSPDGNGYRCDQVPCLSWKAEDYCSKGRKKDGETRVDV